MGLLVARVGRREDWIRVGPATTGTRPMFTPPYGFERSFKRGKT